MDGKPPKIKIYIDATRAPQLARAMDVIQSHLNENEKKAIEVLSIIDVFKEGAKDEEWIPIVGKEGGVVITEDRRIQTSRHQRELYIKHGVGIIFLKKSKSGMTFWQMFVHLVDWWEDIKQIARNNKPPFSYRQPGQNEKFVVWKGEED